jgi:glycosyltransferase involved in cell wall biosynthesis
MKISIVTVTYNRKNTIQEVIKSIKSQSYSNIEHLIIDGASTDGSLDVIRKIIPSETIFISEPDDGIYDALNKGIMRSTGDVVGILHSDDVYASDDVLAKVAAEFSYKNVDAVYADAEFFSNGNPDNIIRRYRSNRFNKKKLAWGWMPAHTTIFFRRSVFESFGLYKTDYKIAADLEFVARVFTSKEFKATYVPSIWVKMQIGGVSTSGLRNTILLNREVLRALRENGIKTNLVKIFLRYFLKIFEFRVRNFSK